MARQQYQPREFLRDAPNALLKRYFQERGLLADVDFDKLGDETDIEAIYEDWQALPREQLEQTEADFRAIDEMAESEAVGIVITEGQWHREELGPILAGIDGMCHKMLWTFIEKPRVFEVAHKFCLADSLPQRYWRKRKNMPVKEPAVDEDGKRALGKAICDHYREKEGRGQHCSVEVYDRSGVQYFFVYVEDYADTYIGFDKNGEFERRVVKPAFEIVFAYSKAEGSLDTYFKGPGTALSGLQMIFTESILGGLMSDESRGKVYELNGLKKREFQFVYPAESGITDVRVKKLRLTCKDGPRRRIVLEADPSGNRHEVYEMMDKALRDDGIRLSDTRVTQVGLVFTFAADEVKKSSTRTFNVSYPNSCPLKHDGRDLIIRQCLKDSGIDESSNAPRNTEQG